MLTIFAVPKPFEGHIKIIQRNAIQSWLKLKPECEVILFGSEKGVRETAEEFGILHVPDAEKNEFGNFIISAVIGRASQIAKFETLAYTSCDIIFLSDFTRTLSKIKQIPFLAIGSRFDTEIKEPLDFSNSNWEGVVRNIVREKGKFHGFSAVDYPVFPRELLKTIKIPPFAVGRPVADNWLIYKCLKSGIPVIDVTGSVLAVHQNHDYAHHSGGHTGVMWGEEAKRNLMLAGGFSCCGNLRNANWIISKGEILRAGLKRRIFNAFSFSLFGGAVLSLQRKIRNFLAKK